MATYNRCGACGDICPGAPVCELCRPAYDHGLRNGLSHGMALAMNARMYGGTAEEAIDRILRGLRSLMPAGRRP